MNIIITDATMTRKAEINIDPLMKAADIIQSAVDNWSLPSDRDYRIINATKGVAIAPDKPLIETGLLDGETIRIEEVLVAG